MMTGGGLPSCIYSRAACMLHATDQNFAYRTGIICSDLSSVERESCVIDHEFALCAKDAKSRLLRSLFKSAAPGALTLRSNNGIATSVLLTIVRCLSSIAHIIHLTILHLPGTILQHPDVITSIEDAESFVNVVKSTLDPVRPGDTSKTLISSSLIQNWTERLTRCSPSLSSERSCRAPEDW
jgi:hypothetical protein